MVDRPSETLRDEITDIVYGVGWQDDPDTADSHKPDVEAILSALLNKLPEKKDELVDNPNWDDSDRLAIRHRHMGFNEALDTVRQMLEDK